MTEPVAIADTNALYRLLAPKEARHLEHRKALESIGHLVVSPMVLAELDYLISERRGARAATTAMEFIARQADARRFEVPNTAPHLNTAIAIMRGYQDAEGGKGVGLTDAMNVALAAAFQTAAMFTTDRHFRMMRPLTGHDAFRLLPDDL
ncbi:PIN domain-containing protein [Streptomyces sp. KR80]|uniref:PIN domain-containing protein n=1 Tax=Streptomyces sp. KR80 TaxID=3457426 RepID=UPI003FD292FF